MTLRYGWLVPCVALSALLAKRAHNLEAREQRASEQLKQEIAEKDALIERLRAEASGTPQVVSPPPPPRPSSPPSAAIPAHYLRRDTAGIAVIDGGRSFDRWRNNNV